MEWAADARATGPMSDTQRLVLVTLAKYAQPDGSRAFPGRDLISHHVGCGVRAVSYALAALKGAGFITLGDQRYVEHYPYYSRPKVYDLAVGTRVSPPLEREDYSDLSASLDESQDTVVHDDAPPAPACTPCTPTTRPPARGGTYPLHGGAPKPKTKTNNGTKTGAPSEIGADQGRPICAACGQRHHPRQGNCQETHPPEAGHLAALRKAAKPSSLDTKDVA